MALGFWKNWRFTTRLLALFALASIFPFVVMAFLAMGHLERITEVSQSEANRFFVALQENRLKERLLVERERLSKVFTKLQADTRALRVPTEALVAHTADFHYRNGSTYALGDDGVLANADDGNSALYCPKGANCGDPLVAASEILDLVMKPVTASEKRVVLAWFISEKEFSRAYPWNDFRAVKWENNLTSWPFYYLAGPWKNPNGGEVFTGSYLDPLSREWMVSCISPVMVGGRHAGTVGLDVTIQNLVSDIKDIRLTANSSSLLLSQSGEIIAASASAPLDLFGLSKTAQPHEQSLFRSPESKVVEYARRIATKGESIEQLDINNTSLLLGHATVEPTGWKIVLITPMEDILLGAAESSRTISAEASKLQSGFFHILLFTLVVAAMGVWALMAHQSRGLRVLLEGIDEFGKGNLNHRVQAAEGDASYRLASALNSMASTLKEKTNELGKFYAEAEQDRKLASLGRLAAGVAHEVNNPLATISTCTQLLLRRKDLPPEVTTRLDTVLAEIGRIQEKLRNMLDLSRAEGHAKAVTNPDTLVRSVFSLARHEADARGIDLLLRLDADVDGIILDSGGLKQVLWNLIGNSLDFSGPGQRVTVSTAYSCGAGGSGLLKITVEDEGPGIDPGVIDHIFDPFFTTKEVGKGTGLGLAISYRIIQDQGGTLTVENLPQRGCRFTILIPENSQP